MWLMQSIKIMWTLLLALPSLNDAFIIHYSQHRHNVTMPLEEEGSISCTCNEQTLVANLPKGSLDKVFEGIRNHVFCTENFETETCDLLKECSNCTAEMRKCMPIPDTNAEFECFTKRLVKSDRVIMKLDPEEALNLFKISRQSRNVNTCSYPKEILNADLVCHKDLHSVSCNETCLFGYTLKEGISRKMHCIHSENIWKPVGFEECTPRIDCSITLLHDGEVNCITGTDDKLVYCNVSCEANEGNLQIQEGIYRCQMDGRWSPKLPFCVAPVPAYDKAQTSKSRFLQEK